MITTPQQKLVSTAITLLLFAFLNNCQGQGLLIADSGDWRSMDKAQTEKLTKQIASQGGNLLAASVYSTGGGANIITGPVQPNHALALRRVEASEESHLARLPAYSPDLNPDEQVWNHPRRGTGKPVVDCKEAMREATLAIMGAIREETELAKSFFRLEGTRDASI